MKGLLYVSLSTSTVLQVEALQLDRDGQPVRRVDDDIISGYPSRPGCYFRQPSRCPARPMQTTMWRHDTWAEEHEVDEAGCKSRKGYWDRYCDAEDTKVVHIKGELDDEPGPEGSGTRSDNAAANGTPSEAGGAGAAAGGAEPPASDAPRVEAASEQVDELQIINGYPSRPGCYFRQPSKCPAKPQFTSMWRHDTWAEEQYLDEAGCRDRKGFWDRYCEAEDTKVVHIGGEDGDVPDPQSPDPGQILRARPPESPSDADIVNGTPSEAAGAGAAAGGAAQPASHAPREENASEQVWEPGRPRVEQQAELGLARAPQSTWQWQNQQCLRCELCEWRCLGAHSSWEHQRCLRSCQWQPECRDCRHGTTGYHGGAPGWGPLARPASPGVGAAELALDGNIEPPDNISADDISVEMPAGLLP
mmetsp:Transcript_31031/g.83052  ORF Transcript_31031/g.83052 Transcript_31031/m.83052 type:complete len:418 (+) Transcript_31031:137-1390(+)